MKIAKKDNIDVQYTVYMNAMKRLEYIQNNADTVAPELKSIIEIDTQFDWEKADIYALGKIIAWIYTGNYKVNDVKGTKNR